MNVTLRTTLLLLAALAAGFVGSLLGRVVFPSEIRARKITLVDATGKQRGELTADLYGHGPNLWLCDATGKIRVMISATENSSGIGLCDTTGQLRGDFSVGKSGPNLVLKDAAGKRIWQAPPPANAK